MFGMNHQSDRSLVTSQMVQDSLLFQVVFRETSEADFQVVISYVDLNQHKNKD